MAILLSMDPYRSHLVPGATKSGPSTLFKSKPTTAKKNGTQSPKRTSQNTFPPQPRPRKGSTATKHPLP